VLVDDADPDPAAPRSAASAAAAADGLDPDHHIPVPRSPAAEAPTVLSVVAVETSCHSQIDMCADLTT
jgi:hypothetical protein